MKFLNIGVLELLLILVLALIVLGPDGIVKTARTLGRTIRKIIRSPIWSMMVDTQRELREMPTKLVREAGLEEDLAEIRKTSRELGKINKEVGQIIPSKWEPLEDKPPVKPAAEPEEQPEEEPPSTSEVEDQLDLSQSIDQTNSEPEKTENKEEPPSTPEVEDQPDLSHTIDQTSSEPEKTENKSEPLP